MADMYRPEAGAPVTAEDAEHRGFATSFRGFDPAEVRAYLRRVAETMRAMQDEIRRLEVRAREAERRAEHPNLDEATLAAALGDETARILRSAHEAAAEIRGRAEGHVEALAQQARDDGVRLTAEAANILEVRRAAAESEAEQILRSATEQAERLRSEAKAEAESIVASASSRAEGAVDEAREHRAAVLSDLRRRRRIANTQIEQLRAGRERLLAAYEVVGRTLGEVSDELQRADLEARAAADAVGRRLTAAVDPEAVDALASSAFAPLDLQADPELSDPEPAEPEPVPIMEAEVVDVAKDEQPPAAPTLVISTTPGHESSPQGRPHRRKGRGGRAPTPMPAPVPPEPEVEPEPDVAIASPVAVPAGPSPAPVPAASGPEEAGGPVATDAPGDAPTDLPADTHEADALFARLRAEREAAVAAAESVLSDDAIEAESMPAANAGNPPTADAAPDRRLFIARDEACEPLEAHLSRRIKRALQDEQNLALDRLRSARGVADLETALGGEPDHLAVYVAIVQPALNDAAAAGAVATGADAAAALAAVGTVATDLAAEIVVPLRRRLDERLHEAAAVGDDRATITDRVGAAYRELKTQRVSRLAADWLAVAWASGAHGPGATDAARRWAVDPDRACCTDCDDNALAGATPAGEPFPTGHLHPPAHPGCRCVLVSATL